LTIFANGRYGESIYRLYIYIVRDQSSSNQHERKKIKRFKLIFIFPVGKKAINDVQFIPNNFMISGNHFTHLHEIKVIFFSTQL